MRIKNFQIVFLGVGVILHLINWYMDIKALWYIGCICIIISPFLPGGFLNMHCKKSAKGQEKENNLQEPKNSNTSDDSLS